MNIRFCDICNESVPDADLARGRAFERKGRIICASCDLAMTSSARAGDGAVAAAAPGAGGAPGGAAPYAIGAAAPGSATVGAAAREPRGEGVALALAAVALVGVGAVAYLARVEVDRAARDTQVAQAALVDGWSRERAALDDALRQRIDALAAERARSDAERAAEREAAGAELAALEARVAAAEVAGAELAERFAREAEARAGERGVDARLAELEGALDTVRADVEVLARTLLDTVNRAVVAAAPVQSSESGAPAATVEPFRAHLPRLASNDAIERWSAIDAIGALGDPAAAQYVVPNLKDPDLFVRMAAARVLGELGGGDAVPALIEALEDGEPSVREQAILALRTITGRSFAFDPNGSEAERGRQIAAWRDWWKRNGGAANGAGSVE